MRFAWPETQVKEFVPDAPHHRTPEHKRCFSGLSSYFFAGKLCLLAFSDEVVLYLAFLRLNKDQFSSSRLLKIDFYVTDLIDTDETAVKILFNLKC